MIRTLVSAFTNGPDPAVRAPGPARGWSGHSDTAFDSAFETAGGRSGSSTTAGASEADDGSGSGSGSSNASHRFASDLAHDSLGSRGQHDAASHGGTSQSAPNGKTPDKADAGTADGSQAGSGKTDDPSSANAKHGPDEKGAASRSGGGRRGDTSKDATSDKDAKKTKETVVAVSAVPVVRIADPQPKAGGAQEEARSGTKDPTAPPQQSGEDTAREGLANAATSAAASAARTTATAKPVSPQNAQDATDDGSTRPAKSGSPEAKQPIAKDTAKTEVQIVRVTAGEGDRHNALGQLFGRLAAADTGSHAADAKAQAAADGQSAQGDTEDDAQGGKERSADKAAETATRGAPRPATPDAMSNLFAVAGSKTGPAGNSGALANQILSRADWTQALAKPAGTVQPGTIDTLKLQLNPAQLGMVTANLRASDGQLVIHLQVQTAEAYRQLSRDSSAIIQKLKGHGYAVETVTVQHVGGERPATPVTQGQHQAPGSGTQTGNGQAGSGQPGSGNAGAGGQRSGNQNGGNGTVSDFEQAAGGRQDTTASEGNAPGRRAGGVYI